MGVNHLSGWAGKAQSSKAPSGSADSAHFTSSSYGNPAQVSGTRNLPNGNGKSFSNASLRPGAGGARKAESGGRLGQKSGQPKVGGKAPHKGMSGGRLG